MATSDNVLTSLHALNPLDGRYRHKISSLASYFSEAALIKYRLKIEIEYLIKLSETIRITSISQEDKQTLRAIYEHLTDDNLHEIKQIEEETKHDVKALEYYLRKQPLIQELQLSPYLHFGLTSEDINNLAYSLVLKESCQSSIFPQLTELITALANKAQDYAATPMLARTHGQAAVPTTVGKELMLFALRLHKEKQRLEAVSIEGKLNGAVGNFNAHQAAFPSVDWLKFSEEFVTSFSLQPNLFSTQILLPDSYVRLFESLMLINSIVLDFDQDIWRYISDGYFMQTVVQGQVGSSTMPQKVNPIDFENSEGNLGTANALLGHFCQKLPVSRLQRDLTDSTVKRNIGSALAYCYVGYQSCLTGLEKIKPDETQLQTDLEGHWEVVTEGLQTILRSTGDKEAYEKLKVFAQGRKLDAQAVITFIDSLEVGEEVKQKLKAITPLTYVGLAAEITKRGIKEIRF